MFDLLIFRKWFAMLALLLAPFLALAAEGGTLRGTVTDPLGAVIVSATVELLDGATVAQKTVTDVSGNYTFHLAQGPPATRCGRSRRLFSPPPAIQSLLRRRSKPS